ncbi:MAG: NifB/NifX family molybdenum-iron cluster-binding protein [Candidatus Latescibacterota bacterium]
MRIAIPVANGMLCPHFGHCDQFAVLDMDEQGNVVSWRELMPPPHEPGVLPSWLHSLGVEHVIAGGMGSRAQGIFTENDITLTIGAPVAAPEELAAAYMKGSLTGGDNVCDH